MACHVGDLVVVPARSGVPGRPGVWRVLDVRHGAARIEAVGRAVTTRTTVPLAALEPYDPP